MTGDSREKRVQERIGTALSVFLGDARGVTRDVSASGVYFEASAALETGSMIDFSVEFDSPNGKMLIRCSGEVVRRENLGDRVGVAVRLTDSKMEMAANTSIGAGRSAVAG